MTVWGSAQPHHAMMHNTLTGGSGRLTFRDYSLVTRQVQYATVHDIHSSKHTYVRKGGQRERVRERERAYPLGKVER